MLLSTQSIVLFKYNLYHRLILYIELLRNPVLWLAMDNVLENLRPGSISFRLVCDVAGVDDRLNMFNENLVYQNNECMEPIKYYLQTSSPYTLLDWNTGYTDNNYIFVIIKILLEHKVNEISNGISKKVLGDVVIVGNKLMLSKPVNIATKYIGLVITPMILQRTLLENSHVGSSGGHMGTYITVFRLKI